MSNIKLKTKLLYKLRAECRVDVAAMIVAVPFATMEIVPVHIEGMDIPDVEVTFTSSFGLDGIINLLRDIPDGHVMVETVNFFGLYNGERMEDRK